MKTAEYRTPEGYHDMPYVHVYDGDALTDGQNYQNISTAVADSSAAFILRQVMGRDKIAARMQLRADYAPLTGADYGVVLPRTYPVAPERFIPLGGLLALDLWTVARANRVAGQVTIFFAQLAFQGVRRWKGPGAYPAASTYPYTEKPFVYDLAFTVNWVGTDPNPRQFVIPINDTADFELQRITLVRTSRAGVPTNVIPDSELKLQLYDNFGERLSNAPVLDVYLNDAANGTTHFYHPVFPVPSVLYHRQGSLRFDVVSLLTAPMSPSIYQICFCGVRRVPK